MISFKHQISFLSPQNVYPPRSGIEGLHKFEVVGFKSIGNRLVEGFRNFSFEIFDNCNSYQNFKKLKPNYLTLRYEFVLSATGFCGNELEVNIAQFKRFIIDKVVFEVVNNISEYICTDWRDQSWGSDCCIVLVSLSSIWMMSIGLKMSTLT